MRVSDDVVEAALDRFRGTDRRTQFERMRDAIDVALGLLDEEAQSLTASDRLRMSTEG